MHGGGGSQKERNEGKTIYRNGAASVPNFWPWRPVRHSLRHRRGAAIEDCRAAQGLQFAHRPSGVSGAGKAHRPRSTVDQRVLRRHRRASQRRNHPALHHTMPRTVAACQPPASHPPAKAQGNSRRLFKALVDVCI